MTGRKWLTVSEAADYFELKKSTLYSLAARGRLPDKSVLRLGRQIRINREVIEKEALQNGRD
jgi:excisionase family DNA binding protein